MGGDEPAGPVAARLAGPAAAVPLAALPGLWFHQVIAVTVERPARHDPPLMLLNRVRGAWGEGLKRSASPAALAGRPCSFDPPSAFDVFFREQLRIDGGHGVPKPYVLAMDVHRSTIEIRLAIFGFACGWIEAARDRLAEALAHAVITDEMTRTRGFALRSVRILTCESLSGMPPPEAAALDFLTPLDDPDMDFVDGPWRLIGRLARRVDGMARWMDCAIDADWPALAAAWKAADYGLAAAERGLSRRGSRRQGRAFENPVILPQLVISGDLAPFWPLLVIGQTTHAGRGAVAGLGRYVLTEAG